ncbi:MAG: efflux RND transporter periplasmic adaptor subunit [Acidobacteria bacterium]|nr:efflux RND transporter periplasmic adaptor subunit [Acidobacteriota bacterium]
MTDRIPDPQRPSARRIGIILTLIVLLLIAGFAAGYLPRHRRELAVRAAADGVSAAVPIVNTTRSRLSDPVSAIELPGSIQAVTEAPVLARADGYLKRRLADIGDRVRAGQPLAEVEAPELDQQVEQARAAVLQARAAVEQSRASLEQGRATQALAKVTAERWSNLLARGAVSRQEHDIYQAQYKAQSASVRALEKAVQASESNQAAVEANLSRLEQLQDYKTIRAPFAGVITLRNTDTGALITAGQTLLFRIAQTGILRAYLNVPQSYAEVVRAGGRAEVSVTEFPGRVFPATLARTANALDASSRTMLAELRIPNPGGVLMPGMYAQVRLTTARVARPVLAPGDTLVIRGGNPQVAVVRGGVIHFQKIRIGRDFGRDVEVLDGLADGEVLVVNPGDDVREGGRVEARAIATAPAEGKKR